MYFTVCYSSLVSPRYYNTRAFRVSMTGQPNDNIQGSSVFEKTMTTLKFGYESNNRKEILSDDLSSTYEKLQEAFALCFPKHSRPQGCLPLLSGSTNIQVQPYPYPPCIDGICPYIKFKCAKGHTWKAEPGSVSCLYCPVCKVKSKNVTGLLSSKVNKEAKSLKVITSYIESKGGTLVSKNEDTNSIWHRKITVRCQDNHEWSVNPTNLVYGNTWCRQCFKLKTAFSEDDLHSTAEYFGGKFIEIVDSDKTSNRLSSRKAKWICSEGHIFIQTANNIRRKSTSLRKCSWCSTCRKNGKQFNWREY